MTTVTCPSGHPSTSTDYCDVCGLPIGAAATPAAASIPAPAPAAPGPSPAAPGPSPAAPGPSLGAGQAAGPSDSEFPSGLDPASALQHSGPPPAPPELGVRGPAAALDLGTPPPAPPAPQPVAEWVIEHCVDADWYALQQTDDPCPSPGRLRVVPLTVPSLLIGRTSKSRGISPDIDCGNDTGVSRRQAQLTTDGSRWWIEDLQSANGTYVGPAGGPIPDDPIPPGQSHELHADDHIYLGAWTRLVLRRTPAGAHGA